MGDAMSLLPVMPPAIVATVSGLAECPRCGELKPEREVVDVFYCHGSQGMESEERPCLDCREEIKDELPERITQ